jgi:hypothetical protein
MSATRKVEQDINVAGIDPYEQALRGSNHPAWQRRLTLGTLIFSAAFCALAFHAGWKEIAALEKCALHGLSSCRGIASHAISAP